MSEKTEKFVRLPDPPNQDVNDRRERAERARAPKSGANAIGKVDHDDLGNAVWNWRVDVPARREDDPTIDLLQCLDVDGLSLEDEAESEEENFNPYNKKC